MFFKLLQFSKAPEMSLRVDGKSIDFNDSQPLKLQRIDFTPSGTTTESNFLQSLNAKSPIVFTLSGISIEDKLEHIQAELTARYEVRIPFFK